MVADGGAVRVVHHRPRPADEPGCIPEAIGPDACGLYGIGARPWTCAQARPGRGAAEPAAGTTKPAGPAAWVGEALLAQAAEAVRSAVPTAVMLVAEATEPWEEPAGPASVPARQVRDAAGAVVWRGEPGEGCGAPAAVRAATAAAGEAARTARTARTWADR